MSATAIEELRCEVVTLRQVISQFMAELNAKNRDDMVSARQAESILHLKQGTVRSAAQAGQIKSVTRRARSGEATYVSLAEARLLWGPR